MHDFFFFISTQLNIKPLKDTYEREILNAYHILRQSDLQNKALLHFDSFMTIFLLNPSSWKNLSFKCDQLRRRKENTVFSSLLGLEVHSWLVFHPRSHRIFVIHGNSVNTVFFFFPHCAGRKSYLLKCIYYTYIFLNNQNTSRK